MNAAAPLTPNPTDTALAQTALSGLEPALKATGPVHLRVDDGAEIVVPLTALEAFAEILSTLARGDGVTVLPLHAELTTQQAADALNVSRPFLIRLLEAGEIEYRTVGSHRRVNAASLVAYQQADDARRRTAADALSAETEEQGFI